MLGFKGPIAQSVLVLAIFTTAHAWQQPPAPGALIQQYCKGCHDDSARTANVRDDTGLWEKALRKLRTNQMPLPDSTVGGNLATPAN
jgi:cytochrome c5